MGLTGCAFYPQETCQACAKIASMISQRPKLEISLHLGHGLASCRISYPGNTRRAGLPSRLGSLTRGHDGDLDSRCRGDARSIAILPRLGGRRSLPAIVLKSVKINQSQMSTHTPSFDDSLISLIRRPAICLVANTILPRSSGPPCHEIKGPARDSPQTTNGQAPRYGDQSEDARFSEWATGCRENRGVQDHQKC